MGDGENLAAAGPAEKPGAKEVDLGDGNQSEGWINTTVLVESQQSVIGAVSVPKESPADYHFPVILQQKTANKKAEHMAVGLEARVQIAIGKEPCHSLPRCTVDVGKPSGEVDGAVGIEHGWSEYAPHSSREAWRMKRRIQRAIGVEADCLPDAAVACGIGAGGADHKLAIGLQRHKARRFLEHGRGIGGVQDAIGEHAENAVVRRAVCSCVADFCRAYQDLAVAWPELDQRLVADADTQEELTRLLEPVRE